MTLDPRNDPTAPGGAADQIAAKDKRIKELEAEISDAHDRLTDAGVESGKLADRLSIVIYWLTDSRILKIIEDSEPESGASDTRQTRSPSPLKAAAANPAAPSGVSPSPTHEGTLLDEVIDQHNRDIAIAKPAVPDECLCDCTCKKCTAGVMDPEDLCRFDCCDECECSGRGAAAKPRADEQSANPAAPTHECPHCGMQTIGGHGASDCLRALRDEIRALEAELASKQEDYDDLDSQLHGVLKHLDVVHECPSDCQQGIPRGVRELEKERDE